MRGQQQMISAQQGPCCGTVLMSSISEAVGCILSELVIRPHSGD